MFQSHLNLTCFFLRKRQFCLSRWDILRYFEVSKKSSVILFRYFLNLGRVCLFVFITKSKIFSKKKSIFLNEWMDFIHAHHRVSPPPPPVSLTPLLTVFTGVSHPGTDPLNPAYLQRANTHLSISSGRSLSLLLLMSRHFRLSIRSTQTGILANWFSAMSKCINLLRFLSWKTNNTDKKCVKMCIRILYMLIILSHLKGKLGQVSVCCHL